MARAFPTWQECAPDLTLHDAVKAFVTFYALTNQYFPPDGLRKVSEDEAEVNSLLDVVSSCVGEGLTEVDIILALQGLVTDIK